MKDKDKKRKKDKKNKHGPTLAEQADKHDLYQQSVQAPDVEVEFFANTFEAIRGRKALSLREDFCGTAFLSVEWCKSDPERTALGVDIDEPTLSWGREHNVEPAGEDVARRVTLIQADVRDVTDPKVDLNCALNFSFCLFKTREELRGYFEKARESIKSDGLFVLDMFGGTECYDVLEEETELDDIDATYIWEHEKFNPITNEILCNIHYEFPDGSRMEKAFTYDWRLWSLQELKEVLEEAGFRKVRIYWERFEDSDEDDDFLEGTGEFFEANEVENQESWQAYVIAEP